MNKIIFTYKESDDVVPAKMSVGSAAAGVNDGGLVSAPPGMIAAIKIGANDGTNDGKGVNHSEMGNNLKVRNTIEKILTQGGNPANPNDVFKIKRRR